MIYNNQMSDKREKLSSFILNIFALYKVFIRKHLQLQTKNWIAKSINSLRPNDAYMRR